MAESGLFTIDLSRGSVGGGSFAVERLRFSSWWKGWLNLFSLMHHPLPVTKSDHLPSLSAHTACHTVHLQTYSKCFCFFLFLSGCFSCTLLPFGLIIEGLSCCDFFLSLHKEKTTMLQLYMLWCDDTSWLEQIMSQSVPPMRVYT